MFLINAAWLEEIGALLLGEDGLIKKEVTKEIKKIAKEMLNDFLNEQTGINPAIQTGKRFQRMAKRPFQALQQQLTPDEAADEEQTIFDQLIRTVERGGNITVRRELKRAERRLGWKQSRQYWLGEAWKHDWRSQPRDVHGRWIQGRLSRPFVSKNVRRTISARRRAARQAFRAMRLDNNR